MPGKAIAIKQDPGKTQAHGQRREPGAEKPETGRSEPNGGTVAMGQHETPRPHTDRLTPVGPAPGEIGPPAGYQQQPKPKRLRVKCIATAGAEYQTGQHHEQCEDEQQVVQNGGDPAPEPNTRVG